MTGPASQTTGRCTVSFVPTESPLDIFLHEGVGQFRRVGLKESAEGFRQEVVQVSRAALGNERPCLGGERCGQLSFDSDPFHAGRIAGGTEGSKLMRTGGRRDIMLSYWRARRRASGGETRRLGVLIAEAIWRLFNQPAVVALLRQPAPATAGRDKAAYCASCATTASRATRRRCWTKQWHILWDQESWSEDAGADETAAKCARKLVQVVHPAGDPVRDEPARPGRLRRGAGVSVLGLSAGDLDAGAAGRSGRANGRLAGRVGCGPAPTTGSRVWNTQARRSVRLIASGRPSRSSSTSWAFVCRLDIWRFTVP